MCGWSFGDLYDSDNGRESVVGADEYVLDTATVRSFIANVRGSISASSDPGEAIENIRPLFFALLNDDSWLPARYQEPVPQSGMGGGIGQWLLFRSAARDLCLFALVVPPGEQTPVHDHLAWGLVGLYRGQQLETVYSQRDEGAPVAEKQGLAPAFTRTIERGDFYPLLPPAEDIHQVRTTSAEPSVSIHLLTNDTGCVWRHTYEAQTSQMHPFRSGYANRNCDEV